MGRERAAGMTVFLLLTAGVVGSLVSGADVPAGMPKGEASMHTDAVTTIAADRDNRYLVTGSDDKTVRVWDLPTGRLLRVITPPAGQGDAGQILAVAISPDGRTVACRRSRDRARIQLRHRRKRLGNTDMPPSEPDAEPAPPTTADPLT